jgi:hypothetical protein
VTFQAGEAKNRPLFDLRLGGGHIGRHQALPETPASDCDLQQAPEDIAIWMAQPGVVILITFCDFSTSSVTSLAQEDQAEESIELAPNPLIKQAASADEVARGFPHPNSVPGTFNFNLDYFTDKGDLPGHLIRAQLA